MKFLHLAAPGRNVGDNALIMGMRQLFCNHELILKNVRTTVLNNQTITKINNSYDGLIIGGGGLLHSTPSTRSIKTNSSGTLINIDTNNIKKIQKPIIIYGVGYNVFDREVGLCNLAKKSILDMINLSLHFSVRNDESKKRLINFLGKEDLNIKEVPDPGLYCQSNPSKYEYLSDNKSKNIAIQLAADRLSNRFKSKQEISIFIDEIKKFINTSQNTCWLVPHTPADNTFIKKHFAGYKIYPLKTKLEEASVVMGFYEQMKCVIGQRGHANICPFGLNVPIISLVSHQKNIGFMKKVGFANYALDVGDQDLHNKLISMVKTIDEQYYTKQKKTNKELRQQSETIVERIINESMHYL